MSRPAPCFVPCYFVSLFRANDTCDAWSCIVISSYPILYAQLLVMCDHATPWCHHSISSLVAHAVCHMQINISIIKYYVIISYMLCTLLLRSALWSKLNALNFSSYRFTCCRICYWWLKCLLILKTLSHWLLHLCGVWDIQYVHDNVLYCFWQFQFLVYIAYVTWIQQWLCLILLGIC